SGTFRRSKGCSCRCSAIHPARPRDEGSLPSPSPRRGEGPGSGYETAMTHTPSFTARDHALMARALRLAHAGLATTQPNPRVGCVIAQGDEVVGEGWHRRAGGPHAEVFALEAAGRRARGATAYVTLEPCGLH